MKTYKIEITQSERYMMHVEADNEEEAKVQAEGLWNEACEAGVYHYLQQGDTETEFTNVYDVTGTDDQ